MQIKNGINYYSLYEYLGHKAGGELGKLINLSAQKTNQPKIQQEVSNPVYKGLVQCYTREFLDSYFYAK